MSPLNVTCEDTVTGPVVHVAGDLDHACAPTLRHRIDALDLAPGRRLVIDLAGMDFCDSSGITALLAARQRALAAGADIALAAVPKDTLRILAVVGLDQVFTVHPDADSATAG
ncbi:STAS domain-containing protein [Streptomyces pactum]|uniref:Anti-sigma factor antagonist n=1 Tax=Streptomyces pactum TaxID=68249 RepID=A0ABS0NU87_9ACTN|nr:STAS domain-containing protein [Streptomyces pactum]MBH5338771.1 STAS domain-containing protein [Streptomyces pactum]